VWDHNYELNEMLVNISTKLLSFLTESCADDVVLSSSVLLSFCCWIEREQRQTHGDMVVVAYCCWIEREQRQTHGDMVVVAYCELFKKYNWEWEKTKTLRTSSIYQIWYTPHNENTLYNYVHVQFSSPYVTWQGWSKLPKFRSDVMTQGIESRRGFRFCRLQPA